MASFSPSSNAPPVSDPALSPGGLFSSPPPSQLPPSTFPQDLPPPPFVDPPPATVVAPSRPPISAAPPPTDIPTPSVDSPPPASPIPPADSPPPPSPIPQANSPPPPSPVVPFTPADSPPPPSPIPPATTPPPPSLITPADSPPPPSPIPQADSPPPPSPIPQADSPPPPISPIPPANTPPPSSPKRPTNSLLPPLPPSSPSPPASSPPSPPPPFTSPPKFPHTPPSNPPPRSPPSPSFSPPPIQPPPSSVPPRPILSPPPHKPPSQRPPTNSSSPSVITLPPPPPPSINSSSPPVIVVPPPFRQPAPSPSEVLISPSSNGGIGTGGIVGITAVLGIVLLTTIITGSWCLFKRKNKIARHNGLYGLPTSMGNLSQSTLLKRQTSAVEIGNLSANGFVYSPKESTLKFRYEDLFEATNGFSPRNLLGSGGFGYVYKGILSGGTEVAVKELKIGGGQGESEFSAEVDIISRIHHRYLVSLVGYCISENKRLLVYEYVPNNTLYYHLHVSELVLDWSTRDGVLLISMKTAIHVLFIEISNHQIFYLDKNFEAWVSDFGLAKLAADATHVTTRVMGTFGYMAPEYARSGNLSEKSDVFSFGVVLLELITGRKPVDASQRSGDEGLVEWARPLLSHALETEDFKLLVDPKLGLNFVPNEMFRMIEAAAACIRHSATKRPRMGQIVRAFENLETEDLNNGMRVGESEIYNSAQQSAEIKLFQRMAFGSHNYSTDYFTQGSWAINSTDW